MKTMSSGAGAMFMKRVQELELSHFCNGSAALLPAHLPKP